MWVRAQRQKASGERERRRDGDSDGRPCSGSRWDVSGGRGWPGPRGSRSPGANMRPVAGERAVTVPPALPPSPLPPPYERVGSRGEHVQRGDSDRVQRSCHVSSDWRATNVRAVPHSASLHVPAGGSDWARDRAVWAMCWQLGPERPAVQRSHASPHSSFTLSRSPSVSPSSAVGGPASQGLGPAVTPQHSWLLVAAV